MGYMTDGLTFRTLRDGNKKRLSMFRNKQGKLIHPHGQNPWTPAQWLQAVVGELGEYANLRKKVERGDYTAEQVQEEIAAELADITIYLDLLAQSVGVNLGQAVLKKWNEVSERVKAPIRIDAEDWHFANPPNPVHFAGFTSHPNHPLIPGSTTSEDIHEVTCGLCLSITH